MNIMNQLQHLLRDSSPVIILMAFSLKMLEKNS